MWIKESTLNDGCHFHSDLQTKHKTDSHHAVFIPVSTKFYIYFIFSNKMLHIGNKIEDKLSKVRVFVQPAQSFSRTIYYPYDRQDSVNYILVFFRK